jgi:phosphatidylglycerol:prolipoprotein diacylglycerol transferase
MMPIVQVGSFSLPIPSLIIIAGIWLGFTLSEHRAGHHGISKNQLGNLLLLALITGLVGARLAYVFHYPSAFRTNLLDIFSRNTGLFDIYGGIAVACIVSLIFIQRNNLKLYSVLDSFTPALAVLGVAIGVSHLASGDYFGIPTNLPWAIKLWGTQRHPTQIYEIIFAIIIFLFILQSHQIFKSKKAGSVFLSFVALTAAAHIFIGAFRDDSILMAAGIRRDQIIAWIILAITLWGLGNLRYKDLDTQRGNSTLNTTTRTETHI